MKKERFVLLISAAVLSSCAGQKVEYEYPEKVRGRYMMPSAETDAEKNDVMFDKKYLTFKFGGEKEEAQAKPADQKPVEKPAQKSAEKAETAKESQTDFLWAAAVNVMSAHPLSSASRADGLILTEWFNGKTAAEQFKATVVIVPGGKEKSGLKVVVFRRVRDADGDWVEKPADPKVAQNFERDILLKQQQMEKTAAAN